MKNELIQHEPLRFGMSRAALGACGLRITEERQAKVSILLQCTLQFR